MMVMSMRPRSHLKWKIHDGLEITQCKIRTSGIEILDEGATAAFVPPHAPRIESAQAGSVVEDWIELLKRR